MRVGILLSDVPREWGPRKQLDALLRQVEAAQRNGFTYITLGQHFLYGDLTWLQPVPVLARLAAEVDRDVRLVTSILIAPLYHPVLLAEELATLDIMTEGRLVVGCASGYRREEFQAFGVPYEERTSRLEECLDLMRRIWTEEAFDHDGPHFPLVDARPHIRPWQSPHPQLWFGAHKTAGVRRAGRFCDRWLIPPETEVDEIKRHLATFRAEHERRGLPPVHHPLRRNVFIARDRQEAEEDFVRVSRERYLTYAQRGFDTILDREQLERDFVATAGRHAILGSPREAIDALTAIAAEVPVDPIILRPGWPSLEPDAVVGRLDAYGKDLVPALRQLEPMHLG